MATEIELKLKVDDLDPIRERLRLAHAKPRGVRFEINAFFDTPAASLKSGGNGLRLRSMRDLATNVVTNVITFKGPATGDAVKSREEIEFEVGDFEDAALLLQRLGYLPTLSFEKRRQTWELDECLIELDELPHFGTFVEIEAANVALINAARTKLALIQVEPVLAGYASMFGALLREKPELGPTLRF